MDSAARLTVRMGPDQGKSFPLATELVRIGRGPENEIILGDPDLDEHQASIIHRDGRYAIVTASPGGLLIDGTAIPPERWIWLPAEASIRLSPQTTLLFESGAAAAQVPATAAPAVGSETGSITLQPAVEGPFGAARGPQRAGTARARPVPQSAAATATVDGPAPAANPSEPAGKAVRARKGGAERSEKKGRTTARFITDGPGQALVRLGDDGHLPELALEEVASPGRVVTEKKETHPLLLAGALALSLTMTLVLLFMEGESSSATVQDQASARAELREYYGEDGETLAPYQLALRRSRLAFARGDRQGEREELRQVLHMLRSEAKGRLQKFTGLTGRLDYDYDDASKRSDRRLEELIAILMAGD